MYPEVPAKNYPAFSSISRPMRVVQGTCGSSTASAENRGLRELPLESDEHIPFLSSNFMFSDFEGGYATDIPSGWIGRQTPSLSARPMAGAIAPPMSETSC